MSLKKPLALAVSLDVEEEGLFSGRYAQGEPKIENLRELRRLEPVFERCPKMTFFCAHCAFAQKDARKALEKLRSGHEVEIGAHLHHWNTPREGAPGGKEARKPWTALLPRPEMEACLVSLFQAGRDFLGENPGVFRMGRWDLHAAHWPLLKDMGIKCDASVRPLHRFAWPEGPDHYEAPNDPYLVQVGDARIREVPLTVAPLNEKLASWEPAKNSLRKWGALALLPVEHPLWLMKLTTLAHAARGGKTLSLTWHSSEMMPGGNPKLPDEETVDGFLRKICAYLDWLENNFALERMTVGEMGEKFARRHAQGKGDWLWDAERGKAHE